MAYQYDYHSGPYNDYYTSNPWVNDNPDRFNTGGPSREMMGTASELANGNVGTQFANQMRDAALRAADSSSRTALDQAAANGQAGNYNLTAGLQSKFQHQALDTMMPAYAQGAKINQQGVADAGKLYGEASQIAQKGNEDSLNFIKSFKPEQTFDYYGQYGPGATGQGGGAGQEGFFPAMLKGLLGGASQAGLAALLA